jgi:hypothetical protein
VFADPFPYRFKGIMINLEQMITAFTVNRLWRSIEHLSWEVIPAESPLLITGGFLSI